MPEPAGARWSWRSQPHGRRDRRSDEEQSQVGKRVVKQGERGRAVPPAGCPHRKREKNPAERDGGCGVNRAQPDEWDEADGEEQDGIEEDRAARACLSHDGRQHWHSCSGVLLAQEQGKRPEMRRSPEAVSYTHL